MGAQGGGQPLCEHLLHGQGLRRAAGAAAGCWAALHVLLPCIPVVNCSLLPCRPCRPP